MNKEILMIACTTLVIVCIASVTLSVYFYVEQQNAFTQQVANLNQTIDETQDTLEDLYQEIEEKQDQIWQLSEERNSLMYQTSNLTSKNIELTNLIAALTAERDQAIKDAEDRLAELELVYEIIPKEKADLVQDLENQIQEVRAELAEIDAYNQYLMGLQEEGVNRTTVIEKQITNTGTEIRVTGTIINTGLNLIDSVLYFEAWDLLDEKCINITTNIFGEIGETTFLSPTEHKYIDCTLEYYPYVLSRYEVSVITGDKSYEIT